MLQKDPYDELDMLFREEHGRLYAFVFSKTGDPWLSEEVVQRSFIRWWEILQKKNNKGMDGKKALFLIAKGVLVDERRRELAAGKLIEGYAGLQETRSTNMQNLELKDMQQFIGQILEQLPPKRRQIFEMSRLEEMTYQQIAAQLGISVNTVESQMVKAIKALKTKMVPFMEGEQVSAIRMILILSLCYGNLPQVLSFCKQ